MRLTILLVTRSVILMISDWCDWDCDQNCDQLVINTWVFICGYMLLYGAHLGVYFYFLIFFLLLATWVFMGSSVSVVRPGELTSILPVIRIIY